MLKRVFVEKGVIRRVMENDIGLIVGRMARGSLKTAVRFYRSLSSGDGSVG